jgi:chromosome segregation ATPase
MIITRVKVTDWRSVACRELELEPGLNVLPGENESGKSTIVEAIQKALFWDHTARRGRGESEQLGYIVPTGRPNAKPTVEVDLQIGRITVQVTKVVSDKKDVCLCTVRVREPGKAEQVLGGEPAEEKLRELMSRERFMPDLDWSSQAKTYSYLDSALPSAAFAALALAKNGTILPSQKLEKVRQSVEEQRTAQLVKALKQPFIESAKAGTLAAEVREHRKEKAVSLATAKEQLARVEALRRSVLALEREIAAVAPQLERAKGDLSAQRERQRRQREAAKLLADRQAAAGQTQGELQTAEKRAEEIATVRREIDRLTGLRTEHEAGQRRLEGNLQRARQRLAAQKELRIKAETLVESLRRRSAALIAKRNLFQQQAACEQARRNLDRIERLQTKLAEAEAKLGGIGIWPTDVQIGQWRKAHLELDALKRDALTRLQVRFDVERPVKIRFSADGAAASEETAEPRQELTVGAVRTLRLEIDGVGRIEIVCGATELTELLDEIGARTTALNEPLAAFACQVNDLPEGFDRLEAARIRGQEAERSIKLAREQLRDAERDLGLLAKLRERLAACQQQLTAAETSFESVKADAPEGLDPDGLSRELDRLQAEFDERSDEHRQANQARELASEEAVRLEKEHVALGVALSEARAQLVNLNRRLGELQADGWTEDERSASVSSLRVKLAGALEEVRKAQEAASLQGVPITDAELSAQEQGLETLRVNVEAKRSALAADRSAVSAICSDDPQGEVERLEAEIAELDVRLAREERKLAGLALLDALLAAERRTTARLIAGPLNERISPWLRQIRGFPTEVEIDPATSRITKIITDRGTHRDELPFSEHSEGMKEQLALILRLTLARLAAEQRGMPQFVILDDPLTETSAVRRPEMFRILRHAADNLQILFVTCHDDAASTLPGRRIS